MAKPLPNSEGDVLAELYRRINAIEAYATDLDRRLKNQDAPIALPRIDPLTYILPDANPYEGQRAIDPADEQHMWYSNGEWRKAGGLAVYEIKVFKDDELVVTGDDKFDWEIPEDLDNAELVKVEGFLSTTGSGATQVQLRDLSNGTPTGADILTNKITIDSGERNSKDAATQPSITGGTRLFSWGDHIRIDVDAVGGGAMGLGIICTFAPSPLGTVTLQGAQGAQGEAGGITAFEGQWTTATAYSEADAVSNNGSSYAARTDHTSGATSEPGVGANWEDDWMLLSEGGAGGSMTTEIAQTAHGLTAADIVMFDGTDYVTAIADSEANAEVIGIVAATADANNFTLQTGGKVEGLSGLTAGTVYYLDPLIAGALTATEPITPGQVSKPILIADSTTSGYFINYRGVVIPVPIDVGSPFVDELGADVSSRSLTALNTWEDISGTSVTLIAEANAKYIVIASLTWRYSTTANMLHFVRCVVDEATTGVTPTEIRVNNIAANTVSTNNQFFSTPWFVLEGLSPGSHTIKLQTHDNNSGVDREFVWSDVIVFKIGGGAPVAAQGNFTPTLNAGGGTDPTLGTGAIQTGRYVKIGRLVQIWVSIKFGTSGAAAGSGNYRIANLPFTFATDFPVGTNLDIGGPTLGNGHCKDDSASDARSIFSVHRWSTEQNQVVMNLTGGTSFVNNAGPMTWANNDELHAHFCYETDQ